MIADLHVHTRFSDGSYTARELVVEAKRKNLSHVAVVDHDTTAGLPIIASLAQRAGLGMIPGVEISAFDTRTSRKIHLLGYRLPLPAPHVEALCAPIRERRDARTREQVQALLEAGYPITLEEVEEIAADSFSPEELDVWEGVLFKQHVMELLVKKGAASQMYGDLYRALFKDDGICAGDIEYVDLFEALGAIRADGGVAVLAHPGQQESFDLIPSLVEAGLAGIEVFHPDHSPEDTARARALAEDFDLIEVGGTDDHGTFGSTRRLGEITAPEAGLDRLLSFDDEEVDWLVKTVRSAGELARRATTDGIDPKLKAGDIRDLVTAHDMAVEGYLRDAIGSRHPDHTFLTEEDETLPESTAGPAWIIDPIDGTTNFVSAGTYFAVSVARWDGGEPVVGVVYDVMADECYVGIPNRGAFCNGVPLLPLERPLPLEASVIEVSSSTMRRLKRDFGVETKQIRKSFRAQRALGCASLGVIRVIRGTLDIYLSATISAWDHAAANIVLREVGGAAVVEIGDEETGERSHGEASTSPPWFRRDRGLFIAARDRATLDALLAHLFRSGRPPVTFL